MGGGVVRQAMAVSRPPKDYKEVSSRSLKEAAMGLEAGLGEALRTDYLSRT